ncbi:hypothetical protein [Kocuria dechangensis]|uniref:hypothetical protein n=1 Tax=Kocuria dechangensis TaxID=1176249 RepID=UPI0016637B3F|nr:hypothetical protein [Kocuria dechangensis]
MDDERLGQYRSRRLRVGLQGAGIDVGQLWREYFLLGGVAGPVEVDAHLHQCLPLPPVERDRLVQAARRLLDRLVLPPRASEA